MLAAGILTVTAGAAGEWLLCAVAVAVSLYAGWHAPATGARTGGRSRLRGWRSRRVPARFWLLAPFLAVGVGLVAALVGLPLAVLLLLGTVAAVVAVTERP